MSETLAPVEKPEPEQTIDSAGYWRAAAEGRFELTRCLSCSHVFHYARPLCPACGSWDVESFNASGRGEIYSFTVVHRAPTEAFRPDVPYVLALVDTEEGARLLAGVKDVSSDSVHIGQKLEVAFESRGGTAIPYFVPVAGAA